MGIKQFRSAGSGEGDSIAAAAGLGCWSYRSGSEPDFHWSHPHHVPEPPGPGVLLRRQPVWAAGAQQGG